MTTLSATSARSHLYQLIDQVNQESAPITITGQRGNAILIGEADWQAIQETLYLTSIPGMTQSIQQARREGLPAASPELNW
ncbi:type II toxin-antitoxin system Phd/YefM family antitoxin [Mobiluncus mulieris]|uniref:Antitoxin n=1 Tax=Mobiluncus mulieris TaxID=2052 RepID=A0A2J9KRY7_9ACTO|nr:type II toxin-antitoxin system Phd/YefM family antitoxin [Mobiluncus mulieris]EEJ54598.1 prevent-host-death family protein [Mobiluncus mulieris ATCC 35243]EFN92645.1 prevent-host-death family protein [Mobiluncus mulieris FB024-16]MBB5846449.1 prevent-host-death family protein [Mobiluncus mulieris]MCU9969665.1 type II toxin-antitoxin system Phd/YefM family antitoxin [Mobiluncus mulieris]MCU9973991.1 type II toxin-antitoxin system Phd/YefM family antitoxin [Mobiluncus mulieris]